MNLSESMFREKPLAAVKRNHEIIINISINNKGGCNSSKSQ